MALWTTGPVTKFRRVTAPGRHQVCGISVLVRWMGGTAIGLALVLAAFSGIPVGPLATNAYAASCAVPH